MDEVMDRVVETQLKIYLQQKLCFLGNRQPSLQGIHVSGWQSDSHAGSRVKNNVVRKIK